MGEANFYYFTCLKNSFKKEGGERKIKPKNIPSNYYNNNITPEEDNNLPQQPTTTSTRKRRKFFSSLLFKTRFSWFLKKKEKRFKKKFIKHFFLGALLGKNRVFKEL